LFLASFVFYFGGSLERALAQGCAPSQRALQANKLASLVPAHQNGSPTAYAVGRWGLELDDGGYLSSGFEADGRMRSKNVSGPMRLELSCNNISTGELCCQLVK